MPTLKQALAKKLSKKELELIRGSFDVIGTIAIVEIPIDLQKKAKLIGETLLGMLKQVETVTMKTGSHVGKYRKQQMKIIAGKRKLVTKHKENGIALDLHVANCYYSPRLCTERMRIVQQIKKGERILVAGSGIGVYPLVLGKHTKAKEIIGIEHNSEAHKYAEKNIKTNKLSNRVKVLLGDATKIKLGQFDRLIVAIPRPGIVIVPELLRHLKKGGTIHAYDFAPEENLQEAAEKLQKACTEKNRKCKTLRVVKAGQSASRIYRVCVEGIVK
ncbi:hypothetical protein COV18_01935 [Candidatus Woesearchaeota archaeon CG10_big_fil_rev_8_21_14_0_10_37_12]|nr:MAG: hypothetical protein COV18_01935 [Candidatus Woesearchaeota archaeon CG10_big_fil_rev_8_21_14_0_10_37_12]